MILASLECQGQRPFLTLFSILWDIFNWLKIDKIRQYKILKIVLVNKRQEGRKSLMITQIWFMSTLSMMIMRTSITFWMRLKNQVSVTSKFRNNLLQLGRITQGLYLISENGITNVCFRIPKKISFEQKTNSNQRLVLPKLQRKVQNTNQKAGQLKQLRSKGKQEVNNFGFPSSFGEAGVDFPMFDLHR